MKGAVEDEKEQCGGLPVKQHSRGMGESKTLDTAAQNLSCILYIAGHIEGCVFCLSADAAYKRCARGIFMPNAVLREAGEKNKQHKFEEEPDGFFEV